jgi:hypothetical protein
MKMVVRDLLIIALTLLASTPVLADPAMRVPRDYAKFPLSATEGLTIGNQSYRDCMAEAIMTGVSSRWDIIRCNEAFSRSLKLRIPIAYERALFRVGPPQRAQFQRNQEQWQARELVACDVINDVRVTEADKDYSPDFSTCQVRELYRRWLWLDNYR